MSLENPINIYRCQIEEIAQIKLRWEFPSGGTLYDLGWAMKDIQSLLDEVERLKSEETKRGPYPLFDQNKIRALHDENDELREELRGMIDALSYLMKNILWIKAHDKAKTALSRSRPLVKKIVGEGK